MKLVLGLGNPGSGYVGTRHNLGVEVVETLAQVLMDSVGLKSAYGWRARGGAMVWEAPGWKLVKTREVFMNESGRLVADCGLVAADLLVVHDDLDIALGEYKLQRGRGPKDHNGVAAIEEALGTKDFWRARVGIENRDSNLGAKKAGVDYVLERFSDEEKKVVRGVVDAVAKAIINI